MQRVIRLTLPKDYDLINTIKLYNSVCNMHLRASIENNTKSKLKLHNMLYKKVREQFPELPSQMVQLARDNAVEMLKCNKGKTHTTKKDYSAIRYNQRTFSGKFDGNLSLSSICGRKKLKVDIPKYYLKKYSCGKMIGGTLSYHKDKLKLNVFVDLPEPEKSSNTNVLGIDLGINKLITTSDGLIIKPKHLNKVKRKYAYLKSHLQSKGTPSAKRHLKKLSGKEKRFKIDCNHKLSKQLSEKDYGVFAMENLKNIRKGRKGKVFNRKRSQWSYYQLRQFLTYKLEEQGKSVVLVDPRYTSQRCSKCGYIDKSNRNKGWFRCKSCDYQSDSDENASKNISQIGAILLEQGSVNNPIVTTHRNYSLQNKPVELQANHFSGW